MSYKPRRLCGWCGRLRTNVRKSPGDGYECRIEARCGAKAYPLQQRGTAEVLRVVTEHGWNLKRSASTLSVHVSSLSKYLERNAPTELAEARRMGLVRRRWTTTTPCKLNDAERLRQCLRMHDGNRNATARAMGVNYRTLVRAMARLGVVEFPSRPERVKVAA